MSSVPIKASPGPEFTVRIMLPPRACMSRNFGDNKQFYSRQGRAVLRNHRGARDTSPISSLKRVNAIDSAMMATAT